MKILEDLTQRDLLVSITIGLSQSKTPTPIDPSHRPTYSHGAIVQSQPFCYYHRIKWTISSVPFIIGWEDALTGSLLDTLQHVSSLLLGGLTKDQAKKHSEWSIENFEKRINSNWRRSRQPRSPTVRTNKVHWNEKALLLRVEELLRQDRAHILIAYTLVSSQSSSDPFFSQSIYYWHLLSKVV